MFFLDSLGFFSLTCLLIQCGLAWTFLAFFAVLATRLSTPIWRWSVAFGALAVGLLALSIRFALAHRHIAGDATLEDGESAARVFYGVYFAGKVAFLWFLVGGVAALRRKPWPRGVRLPAAAVCLGFAIGFTFVKVETLLLIQAPLVVAAFAYAVHCLRREPGEEREIGRRGARVVFAAWAGAWSLYGIAVLATSVPGQADAFVWNLVLRVNALVDLTLQVALAASLIVVVMRAAQRTAFAAIEERDRLRERVQRDEKLRALSTLVGGVAHEINNPLTAILGFADDLGSDDAVLRANAARIVREQAIRCGNIVRRMSMLGRPPALAIGTVDLGELLGRVVAGFQQRVERAGMALELAIDPAPCRLEADPDGLEQVMGNLVANAVQATPRGGRVVVSTRVTKDELHLVVVDQGPGVPAADRTRIFEPFWTTRNDGEGRGLGLAVARVLVRAHGGRIEVGDAVGGGAQFEVVLPLTSRDVQPLVPDAIPGPSPAARAKPADGAGPRLLVVDDEPSVRATIERQAGRYGWTVVSAATGEQALDLLLSDTASFDAVVCDLRMPGVSGMNLHDEIVRKAPWMLRRLLFVTGDLTSQEAAAFAGRCNAPILTKPFGVGDLFGRLREVVGGV